ncbi:UbiA family prenyltransferase [Brevundimonas sp.]|uniref:UbiA family prenyltransferase n=1 Tax=Brevundimonas sp. TaxID=1871086 RepID=UPI0035675507
MTSAPLPDAGSNWVDRHAPEPLKPWLKLGRFDRPVGIWLLLLPGWQGIALAWASAAAGPAEADVLLRHAVTLAVLFALGACLMRAAGCAFNDIVDRKIDRQVARTASRPVASGRISASHAGIFVVVCSFISLQILLAMNWTTVMLGIGSLGLVAAYPFMKRITWWPQAWLGLTFNWGALMGFAAFTSAFPWAGMPAFWRTGDLVLQTHAGLPGHLTLAALLLYLGGVFWTLGYDTVYALQDIEDDAMVGVKSSARRLGDKVPRGVAVFYALAVACAAAAGGLARLGPLFWIGLAGYALHLLWQARRVRTGDSALALRLFKSNRDAGFILLSAIILGAVSWPF